jgi:hypothetical protein
VRDAPNPEWSSYAARVFFWQNLFLHGRGLFAILRLNGQPYELWPMNVPAVRVTMDQFGRKTYTVTSSTGEPLPGKTFSSADVIDVPFMLATNMVNVQSPITIGEKALQLALAMQDYGSTFFAGGGVPPLALEGPMPQGPTPSSAAPSDVQRAIKDAKDSGKPFFSMPPDHKLTQIGYDPAKGPDDRGAAAPERGNRANPRRSARFHPGSVETHLFERRAAGPAAGQAHGQPLVQRARAGVQPQAVRADERPALRPPRPRQPAARRLQDPDGWAGAVGAGLDPHAERGAPLRGLPDHPNPKADELFMQGATVELGAAPAARRHAPTDNGGGTNASQQD